MKIIKIISSTLLRTSGLIQKKSFDQFFREYLNAYNKKDKRVIKLAYTRYMEFLDTLPLKIRKKAPDPSCVKAFVDYLYSTCKGGGATSIYSRFKKVVKQAVREGILKSDPCSEIKCRCPEKELVKDILSEQEILLMLKTCSDHGRTEIRKAFIFCLYTGLRFSDISKLTHSNIDKSNRLLSIRQSKTQGHVHIPLREDILELTVTALSPYRPEQKVFRLPSHPTCMKELRKWTNDIGINKHITWHCARHSFASNILMNGADVRVVASLLGHSSLKYVERYTRAVDHKRYQAIDSLPAVL